MSKRCLSEISKVTSKQLQTDEGLQYVIEILQADRNQIWNSVELYQEYQDNYGRALTRRRLIQDIQKYFGDELVVLTSPGYASLITFHKNARLMKMIKDDDESDDIERSINIVAKHVVQECNTISNDKSTYQAHIDRNIAAEYASDTLMMLLAAMSTKFDKSLPALLIANIITNVITNNSTPLQMALGILLRDSKKIVSHLYDYRITCSYDELLRFKSSAATAASVDPIKQGISDAKDGLIQVVADNFDAAISSPNGMLSTHSLAMIIIQPAHSNDIAQSDTIPRLKKSDMTNIIDDRQESEPEYFTCQKKPPMVNLQTCSLSSDLLHHQDVSRKRAIDNDFAFIQDVLSSDKCPEFNGYNTKICREQGHSLAPKTKVVYLPLIDKPPAASATMMTTMLRAKQISEAASQRYTILTLDQQLYRVALHVQWENAAQFQNFYLRLGGMHLLMSYCGCIGTLMADTGIVEILSAAFGGVSKILSGKKFPQNVRARELASWFS